MVKVQQTESIEKQLWKAVMIGLGLAFSESRHNRQFYMTVGVVEFFKNMRDALLPKLMDGEVRVKYE